MSRRSVFALLLLGCAGAPAPRVAIAPVCPSVAPAPVPAPPPHHESLCWRKGRPHAAPPAKEDRSCRPFDAAEVARVEARIRKEFYVGQRPSKLVIDFGCDKASEPVHEVLFEDGSGHGGNLRIVRFVRSAAAVDVRMIGYQHYFNPGFQVSSAQMPVAAFDALVASARVALVARPHLVVFMPKNLSFGISGTSSSNDFHVLLRLADDEGNATERHFTGYDSSSEQGTTLPLRLATEPIENLLKTLSFVKEPAPTDADRAVFTAQFLEAMRHVDDPFFWWVKERFVALAEKFGTVDAVPGLVKIAQHKGEASADRTREPAIAAIAAITGWDPRKDEHGKARSLDDAAAAAAEECAL